jgi:phospholipase/carboxylesterase
MAEPLRLDGPRLAAADGRPARRLVVLLHGVGADGNDLIGLAPAFARLLPEADFVAPDAPFPFDMAPFGRQWFSIQEVSPERRLAGVRAAAPFLDAFLDAELARRGLAEADLALVGFSQGTMMALHVGLRRARAVAGILGYSGMLAGAEALAGEIRSRPPVRLVHGDADGVIPVAALPAAEAVLKGLGVPVDAHRRPGLGHGIDGEGIALGLDFLGRVFGKTPVR